MKALGCAARLKLLIKLGLIFAAATLLSCTPEKQVAQSTLKIGVIIPLSGAAAGLGQKILAGLEMGAADLNSRGGVFGRQIDLRVEDTGSEPKTAVTAFQRLCNTENITVFFTVASSHAMALKPLVEEKGVLLFADVTHPKVTIDTRFIIRHSNITGTDAAILARSIELAGPKLVGILSQEDDWGDAFSNDLRNELAKNGVDSVAETHHVGDGDLSSQITRLVSKNPQAIVVASFGAPAGYALKKLRELNYQGGVYSGVGFALTPDAAAAAGPAAKGTFCQTYKGNADFEQAYQQVHPGESAPLFGPVTYTDLELLAAAADKCGSIEPRVLAQCIRGFGNFTGRFEKVLVSPNGDIPLETEVVEATERGCG